MKMLILSDCQPLILSDYIVQDEVEEEEHIPADLWHVKKLKDCDFWFLKSCKSNTITICLLQLLPFVMLKLPPLLHLPPLCKAKVAFVSVVTSLV